MSNINNREEMQFLIQKLIDNNDYINAYNALVIYGNVYKNDDYIEKNSWLVREYGPKVSLICMNCEDKYINKYVNAQNYYNLEIVKTTKADSFAEIINYMINTDSKYICFLEDNLTNNNEMIPLMVWSFETVKNVDILSSTWEYFNGNDLVAHPNIIYSSIMNSNNLYKGRIILEESLCARKNIYGSLGNVMVLANYLKTIDWVIPDYNSYKINKLSIVYQLIKNSNIKYVDKITLSKRLDIYESEYENDKKYFFIMLNDIIPEIYKEIQDKYSVDNLTELGIRNKYKELCIKKDITFFYTDKGEYYNIKPIADEAVRRGYSVKFTENVKEKAEIGIYCQHVCYPQNSRFSIILLHDMEQGHNRWPNIWELENWSGFDIGILPGKAWTQRWKKCADISYVNPKIGVYELGYPKSDIVNDDSIKLRANELKQKFNMKYDYTVLYAPSWEYFGKEDEFVKALSSLNVNMLIKQANWSSDYQFVIDSINEMRNIHEGKYDNLYYIETEESIMTALEMCDMVVSDESNVMSEALMFGKPSAAVTDWLIPDQDPPRYSCVVMDYVVKCEKSNLRQTVENIMSDSQQYKDIINNGKNLFSNRGNVCKDIIDLVEYYTQDGTNDDFQSKKIEKNCSMSDMWI